MPNMFDNLSDDDKQALGQYLNTNPQKQMLDQSTQWAQNDPTLQNVVQGMAGGTVAPQEGKVIAQAAEGELNPAFQRLRQMFQGESPNASSAGASAIAQQQGTVNGLTERLGYFHPEVKQQQAILNRLKFGQ